jgi:hypothetical protein
MCFQLAAGNQTGVRSTTQEKPGMPHTVRKRGDKYEIVKKLSGGRTQKVGESDSRKKAEASARIRDQRSND